MKKYLFKKIYSLADHCIVNSLKTKNDFINFYNIRPTCIYNPLDKAKIIKLSKKPVTKIFNDNKLKIINVGRLSEEKDHLTFLKALRLIKNQINFEAVIMGRGVLRKKILNFIKENKLKKHIKLINYKSNPYPYIKQSDFLILSSLHEGLPNVLLESVVLKKIIISSDCPTGPREILLNGKGGLFFKIGDYKDLSNKILFYHNNKKKLTQKTLAAFKNLRKYNFKNNLKRYHSEIIEFL